MDEEGGRILTSSTMMTTMGFPTFLVMFSVIYVVGYFLMFRNWSPKHRPDATSCFISLAHGTPAVILSAAAAALNESSNNLFFLLFSKGEREQQQQLQLLFPFAAPNTPFQNLVLEFSIAYFTVDLIHYLVLLPGDYLFIAHHLATLFVFVTCRYLALHGAFAILVLLFLAELTSLCQNIWTLAGLRRDDTPLAATIYRALSPPFYALYTLTRVLAGPAFFYKMSAFYLTGQAAGVIPTWVYLSWIVVVGGAIAVSILWIWNRWVDLFSSWKRTTIPSNRQEKKKER